jgi:hypothetical protein
MGDHAQGTPFSLSITLNPAAPVDSFGNYVGGLLQGMLAVGPLTYRMGPSNLGADGRFWFAPVTGPSVTGTNGVTMVPVDISLSPGFGSLGNINFSVGNVTVWYLLNMGFRFDLAGGTPAISSEVRLTSISVPEPGTLPLLAGAFLILGWRQRRTRRAGTS